MELFTSKHARRRAITGGVLFVVGLAGLYLLARTHAPFVFDPEQLRVVVQRFGPLAPVVYVVAHVTQVVLMAIPGYAMAVVGGYLFGPVAGTAYTMIGVTVGSTIAFLLARRYGRPLVEQMIRPEHVDRFDSFTDTAGVPGLFLFVLVPVLPEDVISFVAGLAYFRLPVFVAVMFFGRLPAATVAVLAGDGFAAGRSLEAVTWLLALVAACGYTYHHRGAILDRIEQY